MKVNIEKHHAPFQEGGDPNILFVTVVNGNSWEWAVFKASMPQKEIDYCIEAMKSRVLKSPKHNLNNPCPKYDGSYMHC